MSRYDVLIVGGGQAGAQTAVALRQAGYTGSVAIIGEEVDAPYERPPLSKEYLQGDRAFERMLLHPLSYWSRQGVDLLLGHRIVAVEPQKREVVDDSGGRVGFGSLVWAAGGHARRLSCAGGDLAGVHSVRTRADVDAMSAELPEVRTVCVIGGGYVGLEATAVLTKLGKRVILLEAQDRVLARVAGRVISDFYASQHRSHDVDIRLGTMVDEIVGADGRAVGVRLGDGEMLRCDMVVVGIGIVPAVEPLRAAGAVCADGVEVDDLCRTTLADVYAVGDCARHRNAFAGGSSVRLESVQNANDMARAAVSAIVGKPRQYVAVPWFWSNQYDLRLQTIGLSQNYEFEVVRGDPASGSFSVIYMRGRTVLAIDCVNATRDFAQGKALLMSEMDSETLAKSSVPLKEAAARGD